MSARELIDWTLKESGWGSLNDLEKTRWIDCQPSFNESHYIDRFAHEDGRFHFSPDWKSLKPNGFGPEGIIPPLLPDHWAVIEESNSQEPFRLVTAPASQFLNSTFSETSTSRRREGRPVVMMHSDDAIALNIKSGDVVMIGNSRGQLRIHAKHFDGVGPGVVIIQSVWPNNAFIDGKGVNVLTGADPVAPVGGAAFHDNCVWIRLDKRERNIS